jgi:acyl carrier protein
MTPKFDITNEEIKDLPAELQNALREYSKSGADGDLTVVIRLALKDLGANLSEIELSDQTNFIQDVGLDSLAISEFVFFFEDIFQISISNEELLSMNTLGELKAYISTKLG